MSASRRNSEGLITYGSAVARIASSTKDDRSDTSVQTAWSRDFPKAPRQSEGLLRR